MQSRHPITLPLHRTEPPVLAELTGNVAESRVAGARVLLVEIEVVAPGRFHFFGDICDDDGETVGYVEREVELDAGRCHVGLPMYVDAGAPAWGAYVVSGLRVIRREVP